MNRAAGPAPEFIATNNIVIAEDHRILRCGNIQ